MLPNERISAYRPSFRTSPFGRRFSALLPWMFVVAVVLVVVLPGRHWVNPSVPHSTEGGSQDSEIVLQRAGEPGAHHPVDVIRTIDGDTFVAHVRLQGHDLVTRVRLRGIDAPELKASCKQEFDKAEAATDALKGLLGQGGVSIYNVGPDKYQGRIVADVATRRTANVSAALLAAGHARAYDGGHREGWCARGWRFWQ
ncbi:thermonuclease family protein [Bradyrhizobium sp.]|uniref:thermonuclease family protein n=1 Tax=Bradyrhizobium sp. TaxID=376 RepID=UPI0023A63B35|nr:thermonuclease family protein [Bradyrhizobium sp.]MDE2375699.1 thermonuclease family protein [Bradyrhizobium sp.]